MSKSTAPSQPATKYTWESFANEYYEVTSEQVSNRLHLAAAVDGTFLEGLLGTTGKADLYGPFWLVATSSVSIFVSSTLSKLLSHNHLKADYNDLLSIFSTILSYVLLEGVGVYIVSKYAYGIINMELNPGLLITLTGYSLALLPPAALIASLPWWILHISVLFTVAVMSCLFIYRNAYHLLARQEGMRQEQASVLIAVWMCCHASLFFLIKMRYY
jgi:hypothetical protein